MALQANILTKLTSLLEKNSNYLVEGVINKNLLAADARKYDANLLNTLLKDTDTKKHFFTDTDAGLIFKKDVFLQFIVNKEFLPDSYTKYKIKIGLGAEDGSLLSESGDVVLNWPYKDAILEGGQDKEDQKRSEVFFNDVLAPDQITRLLDNKVFTNWKRYDKDGEHDLEDLKDDDNLIIKGNNLVVLHSLKKRYAGRVKMIYIDPPYNTGNDSFGYNDRFNHASWLTFMRNRLTVAKTLLANDSVLAIQIDDDEHAYLKVLADEIFGRDNFVKSIALKMSTASGVKTAHRDRTILKEKEHILIYKRGILKVTPEYIKADEWDSEFQFVLEGKESGKYKVIKLNEYLKQNNIDTDTSSDEFKEFVIKNADIIWRRAFIRGSWKEKSLANPGEVIVNKGENGTAYYYGGRQMYFYKEKFHEFYDENTKKFGPSSLLGDLWADINTGRIFNEGGVELRNGKKAEQILARLLRMFTNPGDLVMDYHLGSGTTAAVAHKMGRRYIGIEQLYYGDNDPTNRLQNVINGDQSGISKGVNWQGGGNFVYANIMNNSNKFRKRIESAKTDADYLQLLKEATSSSFLSYRVDPKKLNEEEFRKLSSAEKRRLLLELIDNNTLYVNYDDINDPIFKVSEKDKEFNKKLYEKN